MALCAKGPCLRGRLFYIGLFGENKKILSETEMPSVLTFGMNYHLADRYQVQIMPLWPFVAPPPRGHILRRLI